MKKTRLLICMMLVFVMLFGAIQAFATETTTEETCEHQFQDDWKTSTEEHWHYCLKCKKKIGVEPHTFGEPDENYQQTCSECGKKVDVPHEHEFSEEWTSNAYKHFHVCTATYGLRGEDFCKACRAKNAKHVYDENGVCTVCGEGDHTYGEDGLCTVCGAEDVVPDERPGDAGIKWSVIIVIGVVGAAAAAAVLLIKKKEQ